jgi:hypothetical protein
VTLLNTRAGERYGLARVAEGGEPELVDRSGGHSRTPAEAFKVPMTAADKRLRITLTIAPDAPGSTKFNAFTVRP